MWGGLQKGQGALGCIKRCWLPMLRVWMCSAIYRSGQIRIMGFGVGKPTLKGIWNICNKKRETAWWDDQSLWGMKGEWGDLGHLAWRMLSVARGTLPSPSNIQQAALWRELHTVGCAPYHVAYTQWLETAEEAISTLRGRTFSWSEGRTGCLRGECGLCGHVWVALAKLDSHPVGSRGSHSRKERGDGVHVTKRGCWVRG